MQLKNFLCLLTISITVFHAGGALAEKGGRGRNGGYKIEDGSHHSKSHSHHNEGEGHRSKHYDTIVFVDADRVIIQDYLRTHYGRSCPPGLAKKGNGCLPPGQAKKLYTVGHVLEVPWDPVPDVLIRRLHPAPAGYHYVMVDKDVLLIGEASKKVIDAITLLSAVQY